MAWRLVVFLGGDDISSLLTGVAEITGSESSARVARFSFVATSQRHVEDIDGADVVIDVIVDDGISITTTRRFTGFVEQHDLDLIERVVHVSCRDGYQDTISNCASGEEVNALLPKAVHCPDLLKWSDSSPDPIGYFDGLMATFAGAAYLDEYGHWTTCDWGAGATEVEIGDHDCFDGTISVRGIHKSAFPSEIVGCLTVRFPRLHCAVVPVFWDAPNIDWLVLDGLAWPNKSTILQALAGLSGWYVKGVAEIVGPTPGYHPVIAGGVTNNFIVTQPAAEAAAISLSASLYHRWYQMIDARYVVSMPLGGDGDIDRSVSSSLESAFDAGAWESAPNASSPSAIYLKNAPVSPIQTDVVRTGFEGLPPPYPPDNSAVDYLFDINTTRAIKYLSARVLRLGVSGARKRSVDVACPFNPLVKLGVGAKLNFSQFMATGQVTEFLDRFDHDSGAAETRFSAACPRGTLGAENLVTVTTPADFEPVAHAFLSPSLANFIGGANETSDSYLPDEAINGWLANVNPLSKKADPDKPFYQEQFRITMPSIPSSQRDPRTITVNVPCIFSVSGSVFDFKF